MPALRRSLANCAVALLAAAAAAAATAASAGSDGHHVIDGVALAGGAGARGTEVNALRMAVRRDWRARWWRTDRFHFTGHWDVSVAYFDAAAHPEPTDDGADTMWAVAVSPVIRWQFEPIGAAAPFLELGVGASAFTETEFASGGSRPRELGSHLQFEDRGSVGVALGARRNVEIAYQRFHYSNLDLGGDNDGIDTHLLSFTWKL